MTTTRLVNEVDAMGQTNSKPVLLLHLSDSMSEALLTVLSNLFGDARLLALNAGAHPSGAHPSAPGKPPAASKILAAALAATDPAAPGCITGVAELSMLAEPPDTPHVFALLCHPLARLRAWLSRMRAADAAALAPFGLSRGFSLDDALDSTAPNLYRELHNPLCRLLCRDRRADDPAAPIFWNLEAHPRFMQQALATLERMPFGLAEAPVATLAAMRQAWRLPYALAMPGNSGLAAPDGAQAEFDAGELRDLGKLAAANALDIVLYEAAAAMFHARRRAWPVLPELPPVRAMFTPRIETQIAAANMAGRQGFLRRDAAGHVWLTDGEAAHIHFQAPLAMARISLRVHIVQPDYPVQEVRVQLNGRPLDMVVAPADGDAWVLATGPEALHRSLNSLSIMQPYGIPPCFAEPQSLDTRALGVALISMALRI